MLSPEPLPFLLSASPVLSHSMESGDKSQGFLPQDADDGGDGSTTPPHSHRAMRPDDTPVRAAPSSSSSSSAYAGVSSDANNGIGIGGGNSIDQPYRSEHYRDYPVSAAERKAMDDEAAAAEAYELDIQHHAALSTQQQQQRMLSSSLTNGNSSSSSDNYGDEDGRDDDEDLERARRGGNELDPSRADPLPTASSASSSSSSSTLSAGASRLHVARLTPLEIEAEEEYVYSVPWRSALVAFLLLRVGSTLGVLGLVHLAQGAGYALPFILVGIVLLIPGCYQTYQIYHAWRRVRSAHHHAPTLNRATNIEGPGGGD